MAEPVTGLVGAEGNQHVDPQGTSIPNRKGILMAIDMTSFATPLTRLLGCRYPVISAGMGGPARAELAAAVSHASGFGLLGMLRESPELISREIAAVRAATDQPFGVNLIPSATDPALLAAELDVCLAARVPAICFFWEVVPEVLAKAKDAGTLVLYQVGSLEDALAAEKAGADVVIAQGIEAGGHVRARTGILTLLPEIVRHVRIPVVASGGFATGEGLVAALALGAAEFTAVRFPSPPTSLSLMTITNSAF
ncbi:MAG: nitronate monooxygenase [Pseudomonadota bacterium]|jgi:nitronate monooxygenase|nr:nitronate monooxygenase [Paraburkholderia ferrariae]USX07410.1 nitronate monooxygenase [Paraburkholderia fungorum]